MPSRKSDTPRMPSRKSDKMLGEDLFCNLPNEMIYKIFSLLDWTSLLSARCVCLKWKSMLDTYRPVVSIGHLTDETASSVIKFNQSFYKIKIDNFLGKGNSIVSATRGIGRVLQETNVIEIDGINIDHTLLSRMMKYATESLTELKFRRTNLPIIESVVLHSNYAFSSLKELTFAFKSFPQEWHTKVFNDLTNRSNSLNPPFPCLHQLRISYEMATIQDLFLIHYMPQPEEFLENYISIYLFIISLRNSLKRFEIVRNDILRTALVMQIDLAGVMPTPDHRAKIQGCLDAIHLVQLDHLYIGSIMDEGAYPWVLENALVRRQQKLKTITLNKKLCAPDMESHNLKFLFSPNNATFFTSVKISMTCFRNEPVNLSLFSECPNLETLSLALYRGFRLVDPVRENMLHFSNVEHLPRRLKTLKLKSGDIGSFIIQQHSILRKHQLQWIIANLRQLETFWVHLVTEETNPVFLHPENDDDFLEARNEQEPPVNPPPPPPGDGQGMVQIEAVIIHDGRLRADPLPRPQLQPVPLELINSNVNIDPQMFRDILALPRIQEIKLDMMKASQLGATVRLARDGNHFFMSRAVQVSNEDIREYLDLIRDSNRFVYDSSFSTLFLHGFIELTLRKC